MKFKAPFGSALLIIMLGFIVLLVARFVVNIYAAKIISPADFAVLAFSTSILGILTSLSDFGFKQYIINCDSSRIELALSAISRIQRFRGFVLGFFILLFAFGLYYFGGSKGSTGIMGHPSLGIILALVAIGPMISGFRTPNIYVSFRHMNPRGPLVVEMITQLCGLLVSVVLVGFFKSPVGFVGGTLSGAVLSVFVTWFIYGQPKAGSDGLKEEVISIAKFGRWIWLSSFAIILTTVGDKVYYSFFLDAAQLGIVVIALSIIGMPGNLVSQFISSLGMPSIRQAVSRNIESIRMAYYKARLISDFILLFASGLLYAISPWFVEKFYDIRYASLTGCLMILSFGLILARHSLDASLYTAMGRLGLASAVHWIRMGSLFLFSGLGYVIANLDGLLWGMVLSNIPHVIFVIIFTVRLKIMDFWREATLLVHWPIGYVVGYIILTLISG